MYIYQKLLGWTFINLIYIYIRKMEIQENRICSQALDGNQNPDPSSNPTTHWTTLNVADRAQYYNNPTKCRYRFAISSCPLLLQQHPQPLLLRFLIISNQREAVVSRVEGDRMLVLSVGLLVDVKAGRERDGPFGFSTQSKLLLVVIVLESWWACDALRAQHKVLLPHSLQRGKLRCKHYSKVKCVISVGLEIPKRTLNRFDRAWIWKHALVARQVCITQNEQHWRKNWGITYQSWRIKSWNNFSSDWFRLIKAGKNSLTDLAWIDMTWS